MADQYGLFWNSVNNDRGYTADSFAEWLNHFFTTGVFSGELQVTAASGMDIKVGSGYVNLKGKVRFFDSASTYTLATAGATYPRFDTVVVERNDTDRKISIKVVTGTYNGSSPSPTAPVRSAAIYQIVLAQIYVAAGATKITQENITDTRSNNSVCGIVTGTVKEMDYNQFAAQFNSYYSNFKASNKADFDAWFNEIKGQLTSDAAGKLQTEINSLSAVATTSANGLMSAEDKSKLDNLQVGGRNLLVKNTMAFKTISSDGLELNMKYRLSCDFIDCRNAENITIVIHDIGSFKGVRFGIHFYDETKKHIKDSGWINTKVGNINIISLANGDEYFRYIRAVLSFSETSEIVSTNNTESINPLSLDFVENKFKAKIEKFTTPTDWTPAPEDADNAIKALNSNTKSFTLSASSWSSGSYTISDALITATSNQEILPATTITTDQMKALQKANIIDSGQSAGSLTLKALGTVPTIDIPIRVIFRGTI